MQGFTKSTVREAGSHNDIQVKTTTDNDQDTQQTIKTTKQSKDQNTGEETRTLKEHGK